MPAKSPSALPPSARRARPGPEAARDRRERRQVLARIGGELRDADAQMRALTEEEQKLGRIVGEIGRLEAAGRVVYADWMRGFGNLLIIDPGEAYLSVYGNNEALLKQPGERVAAGEAVATVGTSGGSRESGLYFELRHLGKSFDPRLWLPRQSREE